MIAIILIVDQLLKYYIYTNKINIILIPKWLEITYAENTGTVFGIAQGSNIILIITSLIIITAILFFIFKTTEKYSKKRKIWQLILAGGISNLIDRIFRGYVIDYVSLRFFGICNVADFCIVIGVILLVFHELKNIKK